MPGLVAERYILALGGIALGVPAEWDLCRFQGSFRQGRCEVADDHGPQLAAWWRPASELGGREGEAAIHKILGRQEVREVRQVDDRHWSFEVRGKESGWRPALWLPAIPGERSGVIVAAGDAAAADLWAIVEPLTAPEQLWRFCLYGTRFTVPTGFELQACTLHAGCHRFELAGEGLKLWIWALSLRSRLLADSGAAPWAIGYVEQAFPKQYRFREQDVTATENGFRCEGRRRFRPSARVGELVWGNTRALLLGTMPGDQLYLALFTYRRPADRDALAQLTLGDAA